MEVILNFEFIIHFSHTKRDDLQIFIFEILKIFSFCLKNNST